MLYCKVYFYKAENYTYICLYQMQKKLVMERVKMNIIGLSYSQNQAGTYALILSEQDGDRRIPISIGSMEAQSIAIHLEGLKPPRPLTHDLFTSFAKVFDVKVLEININIFKDNIFYSELVCSKADGALVKIDSRTSDAVAIALRFNCPIYMNKEIIMSAGISMALMNEDKSEKDSNIPVAAQISETRSDTINENDLVDNPLKRFSIKQLNDMMLKAVAEEDYEKASRLRDEMNLRE